MPFEGSKNAIFSYLIEVPGWLLITFFKMPKARGEDQPRWISRFFFCFFLGLGTSILFLIVAMVVVLFFTAVTGFDMSYALKSTFIPTHSISLALATWFFAKEIERLKYFGLDYQNNIQDSDFANEFNDVSRPEKMETLKMLTILDLKSNVGMKELRARYFHLSKLYHPDRLMELNDTDRKVAEDEFKRIKNAYEYLLSQIESGEL